MGKIILKGYYGFGNFGDDILMITTYHLIKGIFPSHEILICSENNNSNYITKLIGDSVPVINNSHPFNAEWIIHGGGGVFFDFKKGDVKSQWLNYAITTLGYFYFKKIFNLYQKLKGRRGIESKFRVGLGIGIGTYTKSSSKFYIDILSLSDFDFLLVRDDESLQHVSKYNFNYPVHVATDLAFLHELWNPKNISAKKNNDKVIGFVLRDWTYDNNAHVQVLLTVCIKLHQQGSKLKFYSLDKMADQYFIQKFANHFSVVVWDPNHMSISDFIDEMSACSLIVSSRAHGAIVSACLGIPVICLALESKLEKIHKMLPNSSLIVSPIHEKAVMETIHVVMQNQQPLQKEVSNDVAQNRELMNHGIAIFKGFIYQSLRT